jgi:hypothetical protein
MRSDAFETHIRKFGDTKGRPTDESSRQMALCPICSFLIDRDHYDADQDHMIMSFAQEHFRATGRPLDRRDTQPFRAVPSCRDLDLCDPDTTLPTETGFDVLPEPENNNAA